jgi:hypothetical protein
VLAEDNVTQLPLRPRTSIVDALVDFLLATLESETDGA